MTYTPDKGDIVWLDFDPSSGNEIMKRRPAFVISRKAFNDHTGMAVVAPITSNIRNTRLEVILPDNLKTNGSILVYQLKSLDIVQRQVKFIEQAPREITKQATTLASIIIQ